MDYISGSAAACKFLSTLSLRRAPLRWCASISSRQFAIHALLAESDDRRRSSAAAFSDFYPRSPCGERRVCARSAGSSHRISIHTLLAESDGFFCDRPGHRHFYPRSPCGERPDAHPTLTGKDAKFLSTLSLRRATAPAKAATNDGGDFLSHALLAGERPILGNPCAGCPAISIHALLAESDAVFAVLRNDLALIFYPRSPCGERPTQTRHCTARRTIFYPRSPCGERPTSGAIRSTTM